MGKRKSDAIDDDIQHKKRKKSQTQLKSSPVQERSAKAAGRTPEPPPGLSKGQRKRWRRQERKRMGRPARLPARQNCAPTQNASNVLPTTHTHPQTAAEVPPTIDRALIQPYSTTHLLAIRRKQWNDHSHSGTGIAATSSASSGNKADGQSVAESTYPEQSRSKKHLSRLSLSQSAPVESVHTKASQARARQTSYGRHSAEKLVTFNDSKRNSAIPGTGSRPLLNRQFVGDGSNQRSFCALKPSSIPAHSENTDAQASFKRFSAFLRGRNVDSDEDSDEESESESEGSIASSPPATTIVRPSLSDEAHSQLRQENQVPRQMKHLEAKPSPGELSNRPQERAPALAAGSSNSRRANVGLRRQVTSPATVQHCSTKLAEQAGITNLASAAEADTMLFQSVLPFSSGMSDTENSEDMFRTIDEISRDVFSTTPPLPACKSPASPGLRHKGDQEHGLMTSVPRDHRITRSMSTLRMRDKGAVVVGPALKDTELACYSVHVPNVVPYPLARSQSTTPKPNEQNVVSVTGNLTGDFAPTGDVKGPLKMTSEIVDVDVDIALELEIKAEHDEQIDRDPDKTPFSMDADMTPRKQKRKMTGMTSKHFTPERRKLRKQQSAPSIMEPSEELSFGVHSPESNEVASDTETIPKPRSSGSVSRKRSKGTGQKSAYFSPAKPALDPNIIDRVDFYNTTAGNRNKAVRCVPAGTSTAPVPPTTSDRFGIIQEKLWQEPFWLLIAVTFLNKTTGRAAVPVFWALKEQYVTPESLAAASQAELEAKIWHLGLQRQRSKRLIKIAQAWIDTPPQQGTRWRTLHYPAKGDGKAYKPVEVIEDANDCAGALEIGHIPGCGPYAWDSWRIFCRDVLRGVAHDYSGSEAEAEGYEPEWKRVLPGDKELRACLRWMWLREGYIWNCETGEKREATREEMERAMQGEMEFADEKEKAFAARAAGVDVVTPLRGGDETLLLDESERTGIQTEDDGIVPQKQESRQESVNTTPTGKGLRRSARLRG